MAVSVRFPQVGSVSFILTLKSSITEELPGPSPLVPLNATRVVAVPVVVLLNKAPSLFAPPVGVTPYRLLSEARQRLPSGE
jgi:hypothetical protein